MTLIVFKNTHTNIKEEKRLQGNMLTVIISDL